MTHREHRDAAAAIQTLFCHRPVVELEDLQGGLRTSSRVTVFRALRRIGYWTSYSHAGRFYTLKPIPLFDAYGLWFVGEVRFSRHGTLRATLVVLVRNAVAGYTHEELQVIVGLRVHDTLGSLVAADQMGRERVEGAYVYVDADPQRACAQLAQRREARQMPPSSSVAAPRPTPLDLARVVDVLVALIHHPKDHAGAIAKHLRARGVDVCEAEVEQVLETYGVKKTVPSRSKRSRPSAKGRAHGPRRVGSRCRASSARRWLSVSVSLVRGAASP